MTHILVTDEEVEAANRLYANLTYTQGKNSTDAMRRTLEQFAQSRTSSATSGEAVPLSADERKQAIEALESCGEGGYRDIDGDWVARYFFDGPKVTAALSALRTAPPSPATAQSQGPLAEAEVVVEDKNYPFYELKFIMRVLGHKGGAPKEDWMTAYGMARAIFVKWRGDALAAQPKGPAPGPVAVGEAECENCNQLVRALREATEGPTFMGEPVIRLSQASGWLWTHTKSGGEYTMLGAAVMQTSTPLTDMARVCVYQDKDGAMWVRPASEFNERFKRTRPLPPGGAGGDVGAIPIIPTDIHGPLVATDSFHSGSGECGGVPAPTDVERYRWLRDSSIGQWEHPLVVTQQRTEHGMRYVGPLIGKALDKAINAAILASAKADDGRVG